MGGARAVRYVLGTRRSAHWLAVFVALVHLMSWMALWSSH